MTDPAKFSPPPKGILFLRSFTLNKIVDGDTLDVTVDQGWNDTKKPRIRLSWVDTPEEKGDERKAGLWVTSQVVRWFAEHGTEGQLISTRFKEGSFKRTIATVWVGDQCLNEFLQVNRYAWNTDRNGQLTEARDLNTLRLPDEVTR